jgi:hypothetical protein
MKINQNNFDILKKRFSRVYESVNSDADDSMISVVESKNGPVPKIKIEGRELFIHSRFEPFKEAERFIAEIDPVNFDLFIVFGFGFGYHLEVLLAKMTPESVLLVIEKDPVILKSALENRDISGMLSDERFLLLLDPDEDSLSKILKGKSSRRVTFLIHRGSHQVYPDYYSNISEIARSYLSTKDVNIATLAKFEKIWSSNIARNIDTLMASPGVNSFYDKFTGIPAIVVCAGPTLTDSLDLIKANRNRAIIVAVDTAYKILLNNGIIPHFCVAVDPQTINARYFEGVPETETVLVCDPTVHPSVIRLFRGRVISTGVAFEQLKWLEDYSGAKGEISHGGSVSTNAYDFTRRLGASPVVLTGQDLAFTRGLAHARGSYLDEQVHFRTTRVYNPEMMNRFQLTALPVIMVKGIVTQSVHTNQKMMIFNSWFEKRNDMNLINATSDGAYINGVMHRNLKDIVFKEEYDIENRIKSIFESALEVEKLKKSDEKLLKKIERMSTETESLIPILDRAVSISEELSTLIGRGNKNNKRVDAILGKLNETDKIIESKENIKGMISLAIQKVLHTITEGHDIDESDSSISGDALTVKKSEYLYRGLLEGSLFNKKIYRKMKLRLESPHPVLLPKNGRRGS